jgi:hypothetical protein
VTGVDALQASTAVPFDEMAKAFHLGEGFLTVRTMALLGAVLFVAYGTLRRRVHDIASIG